MSQRKKDRRLWFRSGLALVLVAAFALAGFLTFSVRTGMNTLGTAHRDNSKWGVTQLEVEYLKLERALDHARSGAPRDLDTLRERFDIFYSRVDIARSLQPDGAPTENLSQLRARPRRPDPVH